MHSSSSSIYLLFSAKAVTTLAAPFHWSTGSPKNAVIYYPPGSSSDDIEIVSATARMLKKGGFYVSFATTSSDIQLSVDEHTTMFVVPGSNQDLNDIDSSLSATDYKHIQDYVSNGGTYLGICAGAYLAGTNYFNLGAVGDIQMRAGESAAQIQDITFKGRNRKIFTEEPPQFGTLSDNANQKVLSKFSDGTANIFLKKHGEGAIGLIAGHPEADSTWLDTFDSNTDDATDIGIYTANKLISNPFVAAPLPPFISPTPPYPHPHPGNSYYQPPPPPPYYQPRARYSGHYAGGKPGYY